MSTPKLRYSVVLPAFSEEENLRLLLPRLRRTMEALGEPFELVVVDTVEPTDATPAACAEHGVTYVARRPSNTYGDAVRTGIQAAAGEVIVFMDADGSHTPEFLPQLLSPFPGCDLSIASRYVAGGRTENPIALQLMSRVLNLSYRLVLGLRCNDVSTSFKAYDGTQLRALPLQMSNFDVIEEILFKLHRRNKALRIVEVPFTFKKRMFGQTKRRLLLFVVGYVFTIVKLRLSVLRKHD